MIDRILYALAAAICLSAACSGQDPEGRDQREEPENAPVAAATAPRPHRFLDPKTDKRGDWREVRLIIRDTTVTPTVTREGNPFIARIIGWSKEEATVGPPTNKHTLPRYWRLQRLDGSTTTTDWPPVYRSTPVLEFAFVDVTYYRDITELGHVLVANSFMVDEDKLPNLLVIRREIQTRLDTGNIWQPAEIGIDPEDVDLVEYRVLRNTTVTIGVRDDKDELVDYRQRGIVKRTPPAPVVVPDPEPIVPDVPTPAE